ncbi:hypothetical protein [Streptosporangium sp. NPDC003464]
MLTPAEELRAAAVRLREAAANATPGPWGVGNGEVIGLGIEQTGPGSFAYTAQLARVLDDNEREEDNYGGHDLGSTEADAAWIAAMHPDLAEPLAAWLDEAARHADMNEHRAPRHRRDLTWALAVARVILGGAQ